jgi:hypothetical protein
MMPRVPVGACVLTKSTGNLISEAISWWTYSQFSHVMPHVGDGFLVDATVPHVKVSRAVNWFDEGSRVAILAPTELMGEEEKVGFCMNAQALIRKDYDLLSFVGFLFRKKIEGKEDFNCAEVTLAAYHGSGYFKRHTGNFITPQTFWDWYCGGIFRCLYYGTPTGDRYFDFIWETD